MRSRVLAMLVAVCTGGAGTWTAVAAPSADAVAADVPPLGPIQFDPADPVALEPVHVTFSRSVCDHVDRLQPSASGLQIVLRRIEGSSGCSVELPTSITLGALGPGTYFVAVVRITPAGVPVEVAGGQLVIPSGNPPRTAGDALPRVDFSGTWIVRGEPSTAVQVIHATRPRGAFGDGVTLILVQFDDSGAPTWSVVSAGSTAFRNDYAGDVLRYRRGTDGAITSERVGSAFASFYPPPLMLGRISTNVDGILRTIEIERYRWQHAGWSPPFVPPLP